MFDVKDDAKDGYRRIERLTGPGRRRRWSAEEKARVVAETLVPGGRVSEVARRWQLCPQQVFAWRHAARRDVAAIPCETTGSPTAGFVPIVTEAAASEASTAPIIEVELAGALVRVSGSVDSIRLTTMLRAVRASASRTRSTYPLAHAYCWRRGRLIFAREPMGLPL